MASRPHRRAGLLPQRLSAFAQRAALIHHRVTWNTGRGCGRCVVCVAPLFGARLRLWFSFPSAPGAALIHKHVWRSSSALARHPPRHATRAPVVVIGAAVKPPISTPPPPPPPPAPRRPSRCRRVVVLVVLLIVSPALVTVLFSVSPTVLVVPPSVVVVVSPRALSICRAWWWCRQHLLRRP